jgi:hypothetical protein
MKSKALQWTAGTIAVLAFVLTIGAKSQSIRPTHLKGLINDYTPASVSGPWEIRGEWSLDLKGASGHADFSAAVTMERSDEGVILNGGSNFNTPAGRHEHTHHIMLVGGIVTPLENGFQVSGIATIAGNGNNPPDFAPMSPVTIDITGGQLVQFSNFQITFGDPADTHFGTNPLHGVVLQSILIMKTVDKSSPGPLF